MRTSLAAVDDLGADTIIGLEGEQLHVIGPGVRCCQRLLPAPSIGRTVQILFISAIDHDIDEVTTVRRGSGVLMTAGEASRVRKAVRTAALDDLTTGWIPVVRVRFHQLVINGGRLFDDQVVHFQMIAIALSDRNWLSIVARSIDVTRQLYFVLYCDRHLRAVRRCPSETRADKVEQFPESRRHWCRCIRTLSTAAAAAASHLYNVLVARIIAVRVIGQRWDFCSDVTGLTTSNFVT